MEKRTIGFAVGDSVHCVVARLKIFDSDMDNKEAGSVHGDSSVKEVIEKEETQTEVSDAHDVTLLFWMQYGLTDEEGPRKLLS